MTTRRPPNRSATRSLTSAARPPAAPVATGWTAWCKRTLHFRVFLLIRKSTPDKLLPRIEHFGGHVIQTSLSDEDEQRLRTALGD